MGTGGIRQKDMDGFREWILGVTTGIGSHCRGDVKTQCSEDSLESMRVTLVRTPSNEGYRVLTGLIL